MSVFAAFICTVVAAGWGYLWGFVVGRRDGVRTILSTLRAVGAVGVSIEAMVKELWEMSERSK